MIKKETVYRLNGEIVHIGEWDFKEKIDGKEVLVPINPEWIGSLDDVETMENGSRLAIGDYKKRRKYPPLSEFADAYVKQQSGDSTQMDKYVADCLAVKAASPKPE